MLVQQGDQAGYEPKGADVYALGVCLHAFVFGKMPFQTFDEIIAPGEPPFPEDVAVSPELKQLLLAMLEKDPSKRIGIRRAREELPWLSTS